MRCVFIVSGLLGLLTQTVAAAEPPRVAELRVAQVKELIAEYAAADKKFNDAPWPHKPTVEDNIRQYEAWPGWSYLPRFVKLAEARPNDEAALLCCQWILDRTVSAGNKDRAIFDADEKVWTILASYPLSQPELQRLSLMASSRPGPARERFLQSVIERKDVSRDIRGIATMALAQFFALKYEIIEWRQYSPAPTGFDKYCEQRKAANWDTDLVTANSSKFRNESIRLYRQVLATYPDVRLILPRKKSPKIVKLSDKATKSLHALEHLAIGSPAPGIVGKDLHGRPLDLAAYRGRVVMLSFW